MAKALEQVKRCLGRDAVILHTRTFTEGGLFGWGGYPMVEITAARHTSDVPVYNPAGKTSGKRAGQDAKAEGAASSMATNATANPIPDSAQFAAEMADLKSLVNELVHEARRSREPAMPDELFEVYMRLVQGRVAEGVARQLVAEVARELGETELRDPAAVRRRMAEYLESMLPVAGPIQLADRSGPTIIALVGPTGVGKTTTIAKLAANSHLHLGLTWAVNRTAGAALLWGRVSPPYSTKAHAPRSRQDPR